MNTIVLQIADEAVDSFIGYLSGYVVELTLAEEPQSLVVIVDGIGRTQEGFAAIAVRTSTRTRWAPRASRSSSTSITSQRSRCSDDSTVALNQAGSKLDDRIGVHFSVMSQSTTTSVREQLAAIPVDTFVWSRDLEGPSAAVETALSRIAAEPEPPVLRVRKGLYWRTEWTRFGPSRPRTRQIVFEITGPGTGPAGLAAAHRLGLTTQVPGTEYYAVPGRPPRPIWGVKFLARPYHRRELGMRPLEVAVIEALKAGDAFIEADWPDVVERIRSLVVGDHVRFGVLRLAVEKERDLELRRKFATIDQELDRAAT